MGRFLAYNCINCGYEEAQIGIGKGGKTDAVLTLFSCQNCDSVGSTWVQPGRSPLCSLCYDEKITLLADNTSHIVCPKCGRPGFFTVQDGTWE